MAHTMTVKERFSQTMHATKYHTNNILYNISSNINKRTNNNIMQDHVNQGYTFGHLSLIRMLTLDIPSGVATMRELEKSVPQKGDSGTY